MSEWPDAPRLREALDQLADQARTATPARERTRELLEADPEATVVPLQPDDDQHTPGRRPRTWWKLTAVAAALTLAVATVAVLVSVNEDPESVQTDVAGDPTTEASPPPAPTATVAPPPLLAPGVHCPGEPVWESGPYLLDHGLGAFEVGVVSVERTGTGLGIVLTPSDGWEDSARHGPGGEPDLAIIYYVPTVFPADAAAEVADAVFASACRTSKYLFSAGGTWDVVLETACSLPPGTGYLGFGLTDPGAPPTECELARPTILLNAGPLPDQAAWEQHFGCSGPVTAEDGEANLITSYDSCDITLIHVDTVDEDPWNATIDGGTAQDFVMRVIQIPR